MKTIVLPLCPTTNNMYGFSGHMKYKTANMKAWEQEAGWKLKTQWKQTTMLKSVYCGIEVFYSRDRDIDNLKAVPDLLADCGVIKNDSQIVHMNIKKYQDKKNPRIEVQIEEV